MYPFLICAAFAEISHPELPESGDPSDTLQVLLSVPEEEIDLGWSKLSIDTLIDEDANVSSNLAAIEAIASILLTQIGAGASSAERVAALRTYIYKSGEWNGFEPYSYDFTDPSGMLASHKSLHRYLATRRGNCINMPMLFLAIGERMGVTMNITTAPGHVFIQFENPDTGIVEHLETTSGAQPQRIVWQREILPMTDTAIEAGMYMKRLTKRQQVTVMGEALLQMSHERGDHRERIELAELILSHFPECDVALLHIVDASRSLIMEKIVPLYRHPGEMPPDILAKFEAWAFSHDHAVSALDRLGWQPATPNPNVQLPGQGK